MVLKLSKKNPLTWLYLGGALLLIAAAILWCNKVYMDPERAFWGTIERSLASHGTTIQSEQDSNGTNIKQTIRYSFGADSMSHSVTRYNQGTTEILNEVIGTNNMDYTRYLNIKTDQKRADGSAMDFSQVLGLWAKGQQGSNQFFTQAVFGGSLPVGGIIVPAGNLSPDKRAELVRQIRDDAVYQIDFSKTKKQRVNGRMQYTYHVTLQPVAYISLLKRYSQNVGLHGLDQLNPEDYKNQKPFVLDMTIDPYARQLVKVVSPDGGTEQTYLNHDVPVQISVPKDTITGAELQKRLSDLQ